MLGKGSYLAKKCFEEGFVGVDFDIDHDISEALERNDNWREFNREYIPVWLESNPGKSKISCGCYPVRLTLSLLRTTPVTFTERSGSSFDSSQMISVAT
jgi:hypothetical protein